MFVIKCSFPLGSWHCRDNQKIYFLKIPSRRNLKLSMKKVFYNNMILRIFPPQNYISEK